MGWCIRFVGCSGSTSNSRRHAGPVREIFGPSHHQVRTGRQTGGCGRRTYNFRVLGMRTRRFFLLVSTESSYAKPVPSGSHSINLQDLTRGDCSTRTHTPKTKKKFNNNNNTLLGQRRSPNPTPSWLVGWQCNLTRIPAAMRHLLYIHTGKRPGRYEIP
jgi:hypothetical protein